jgi:hypothetical protein
MNMNPRKLFPAILCALGLVIGCGQAESVPSGDTSTADAKTLDSPDTFAADTADTTADSGSGPVLDTAETQDSAAPPDAADTAADSGTAQATDAVDADTLDSSDTDSADTADAGTGPTCPQALCGNGKCDPSEAPNTCADCQANALTCLQQPCAAEWQACALKPGCEKLANCLQNCGGTSLCATACEQSNTTVGVGPVWQPLATCAIQAGCGKGCGNGTCEAMETSGNCPADCKIASAGNGLCEVGEVPDAACNGDCGVTNTIGCQKNVCPSQWAACAKDPACAKAVACIEQCGLGNEACYSACLPAGDPQNPVYAFLGCGGKSCKPKIKPTCGDGICTQDCPVDCATPTVCGDGICQPKESAASCSKDCKTTLTAAECAGTLCGEALTKCKAVANCAAGWTCLEKCSTPTFDEKCAQDCTKSISPGALADWMALGMCLESHGCLVKPVGGCGDGVCSAGETEEACPADCFEPDVCGDKYCSSKETKTSCPDDCATCQDLGCGDKPGWVCCPVSGQWQCAASTACDL